MNLITEIELREELKVSRQAVYQWRKQGLPHLKLGRMVRYNLSDVIEWLNSRSK